MDEGSSSGKRADANAEAVARRLLAVAEEGTAAIAAGDFRLIRGIADLDRLLADLSSKPTRIRERGAA
jgi:hypothetical protein